MKRLASKSDAKTKNPAELLLSRVLVDCFCYLKQQEQQEEALRPSEPEERPEQEQRL